MKLWWKAQEENKDGNDLGGSDTVGTGNDARVQLLNQIGESSESNREGEFLEDDGHGGLKPVEAGATTTAPEPAPTPASAPTEELFTIRVNGQDVQVTRDELISRAQKVSSADQYLADAAEARRQAELLKNTSGPGLSKDDLAAVTVDNNDDLALARAIQMGTEEEAVAAIRQIKSTGPSSDVLAHMIDDRVSFNTAIARFQKEYGDIWNDPKLQQMAFAEDARMLQAGDKRTYWERYDEIGKNMTSWLSSIRGPAATSAPAPAAAPKEDKQARKQAAPAVPQPAGTKAATPVTEEDEETVQDTIAGIAKARGGPQWMQGRA